MHSELQQELKQQRPFAALEEELWLSLSRTTAAVGHGLEQHLRPFGLSLTQYNVLRILRGAGVPGLCQFEIRDRLVAQVPDVPRILDRMSRAGWIERARDAADRRMVVTSLTPAGLRLVDELDAPVLACMRIMFPGLDEARMRALIELLAAARHGRGRASLPLKRTAYPARQRPTASNAKPSVSPCMLSTVPRPVSDPPDTPLRSSSQL